MSTPEARGVSVSLTLLTFVVAGLAGAPAARSAASTWYVKAAAPARGDGSRQDPFNGLAQAERKSARGDTIVVLPSRRTLDGGIALKPGQKLIGAGPPVRSRKVRRRAPRITNTRPGRHSGDAVVLANRTTVANIEVVHPHRGGIYGRNVIGVRIRGNDVSGHNTSCTPGFHIPPFVVPTTVPGAGIPISNGLHNGWAGIMVDQSRGKARIRIRNNRVHRADCGDGIDVRAMGTARVRAKITRNVVRDLRQGDEFESVLAIGLQTADRSSLAAKLVSNRQTNLGNEEDPSAGPAGADTEGVFVNPSGPSQMWVAIDRNIYTNPRGLGGFSANGLEFVSMGDGSRARVVVRNSTFSETPGDVLEQLGLGTNAHLTLELVNVVATRSTGYAGSGFGNTVLIPGNNADCLLAASGGAGNTIITTVRNSRLTDCANNGLTFGSAVANGEGPTAGLYLDISDSEITGNRGANLRVGNLSDLRELSVNVEDTNLSDSQGTGSGMANVSFEDLGSTERSVIDLGGGGLDSVGHNCIAGGSVAAGVVNYAVDAEHNWWGPAGPVPGRVVAAGTGAIDTDPSLASPPASC